MELKTYYVSLSFKEEGDYDEDTKKISAEQKLLEKIQDQTKRTIDEWRNIRKWLEENKLEKQVQWRNSLYAKIIFLDMTEKAAEAIKDCPLIHNVFEDVQSNRIRERKAFDAKQKGK